MALKRIVPSCAPQRVEREIECLQLLDGKHNVVPLTGMQRTDDCTILMLKHFEHEPFTDYMCEVKDAEITCYMRGLMEALQHVVRAPALFLHPPK